MGPFATLPQYGFDYWPHDAKVIQIEADPRRIGLVKPVTVGVNGDASLATDDILSRLQLHGDAHALSNQHERISKLNDVRSGWEDFLDEMTRDQTNAREGTTFYNLSLTIEKSLFFAKFLPNFFQKTKNERNK